MTDSTEIRAFVQGSPHPSWLSDSNGCCIYANPALERLTSVGSEQLEGSQWLDLIVGEDKPQTILAWQESRAGAFLPRTSMYPRHLARQMRSCRSEWFCSLC